MISFLLIWIYEVVDDSTQNAQDLAQSSNVTEYNKFVLYVINTQDRKIFPYFMVPIESKSFIEFV